MSNSVRESREEERKRQQKLARERLEAARKRRADGLDDNEEEEEEIMVDNEDTVSLQEAIARDMDRKHRNERQLFVQVRHSTGYDFELLWLEAS